jgi:hypothetical protein
MELFPTTKSPLLGGYSVGPRFSTQSTPLDAARDASYNRLTFPQYTIDMLFRMKLWDAEAHFNFFEAHSGKHLPFDFRDFLQRAWVNVFVAVGNNSATTFDLPGYAIVEASLITYVNGVEDETPPTFSAGTGENGRDQIIYQGPISPLHTVTASFTGQRVFITKFTHDTLTYNAASQGGEKDNPYVSFSMNLVSQP